MEAIKIELFLNFVHVPTPIILEIFELVMITEIDTVVSDFK